MRFVQVNFRDKTREAKVFTRTGFASKYDAITIRYEGQFVVIVDQWGDEIAYPVDIVDSVESRRVER